MPGLDRLDDIKKAAGTIQKHASKTQTGCTAINSGIQRLLSDALAALTDAQTVSEATAASDAVA